MIKTGVPMQGREYIKKPVPVKCDCNKCRHYLKKKEYCGTIDEFAPKRKKCKYFVDRNLF